MMGINREIDRDNDWVVLVVVCVQISSPHTLIAPSREYRLCPHTHTNQPTDQPTERRRKRGAEGTRARARSRMARSQDRWIERDEAKEASVPQWRASNTDIAVVRLFPLAPSLRFVRWFVRSINRFVASLLLHLSLSITLTIDRYLPTYTLISTTTHLPHTSLTHPSEHLVTLISLSLSLSCSRAASQQPSVHEPACCNVQLGPRVTTSIRTDARVP